MSVSTSTQIDINNTAAFRSKSFPNPMKSFVSFLKNSPKLFFLTIAAILISVGAYYIFSNLNNSQPSPVLPLNQQFNVVAKTQDGKNTNGKLNIQVTGAQKASSMLVQGQNVIVKNKKVFLIINMEITNNYMVPLYTYPVDSFRLLASDGKKYAPTTHQGNVETRPQSTKTSNVGFVVPEDQKSFKVEVGDLNSNKTDLQFSLP